MVNSRGAVTVESIPAWARLVPDLGFPVFVACVLLFQVLHMHAENHQMINKLADEVARMRQSLESLTHILLSASELKLRLKE